MRLPYPVVVQYWRGGGATSNFIARSLQRREEVSANGVRRGSAVNFISNLHVCGFIAFSPSVGEFRRVYTIVLISRNGCSTFRRRNFRATYTIRRFQWGNGPRPNAISYDGGCAYEVGGSFSDRCN